MEVIVNVFSQFLYLILIFPVAFFSVIFYTLAIRGARKRKAETKSMEKIKKWPAVTIQIPTMNELVALRCAKKCLGFDYPKNKYEIIIGDDSTSPEISKKISEFAKKNKIKVTRRGSNFGYKPGNLNYMLRFSRGDIIVIFDSDFIPGKGFLKKIVAPMVHDRRVACVQAKWDYFNIKQNKTSKFASAILMVYHHLIAPVNERLGVSLLFGSGEAVRKSVLKELGGWKDWAMTEDVEFSLRVLKKGYKTVYLEDVVVPGEVPFTIDGLSKQQKRWAYGNTKAFFDNIKWILFGRRFSFVQKFFLFLTLVGYVSAPLIVILIIVGGVVWFTGTPAAIDVSRFFWETAKIVAINSGFLFAMLVALAKEKKQKIALSVVVASMTVGLWVALSVFDGFIKAVTRHRMSWYMIRKSGNEKLSLV